MSEEGGGSAGVFIGAGVGGCAVIVVVIAIVIYCYLKARKEKAHTNMTKSTDVFTTVASNTQVNYPSRSKVNQFPDPKAARDARRANRKAEQGHSNPAYERHGSESSTSSDVEGRDLSPPRVRRPRGGHINEAFSSASSCDESSSIGDDEVPGFELEDEERNDHKRRSYKRANHHDMMDTARPNGTGNRGEPQRRSRRDQFKRNPRSDSPLTIETLTKHEERTRQDKGTWGKKERSKRREPSPSRSYEGSTATGTSLVTEGTEFTATTQSSGARFAKNPSLRRNSPSRSSSHRRYHKEHDKDSTGRRKPRRTRSRDRSSDGGESRSTSRSHGERRSRSGSTGSSGGGSTRSSRSKVAELKKMNKEQAMLPIFTSKNSAV